MEKSNLHKLSVIIPVWQQHELAVVHVRECMASSRVPDEIVCVNDGGEDDLKDKLSSLKRNTKIIYAKILPPKIKWNYTGARNLGVWLSSGDLLSIEDQDHIPFRDFYQSAIEELDKHPEVGRCKTHKRYVVPLKDILEKPVEEWKAISGRSPHQDCAIIRRQEYLKIKGYDERFAGEYGWSATDWRRRLIRAEVENVNVGYQYVVESEKTRGLSYRNFHYARTQTDFQPPNGILNFRYRYEELRN